MEIYKVGGFVRDTILGKNPKDIDYVVVGATPEEMEALGYSQVGADFPVFLHPETGDEYALARKERKVGKGYLGFETDFSIEVSLEDDLFRRDLTINAMAMDEEGNIIDPYNGMQDLNNKVIRHTSKHFVEDPVRALRVARFKTRYGFDVAEDTISLIKEMRENGIFKELQPDRLLLEIMKGIGEKNPLDMFIFIREHGLYDDLLFEESKFSKSLALLNSAANNNLNPEERMVVFLYESSLSEEDLIRLKFPKSVYNFVKTVRDLDKEAFSSRSSDEIYDNLMSSGFMKHYKYNKEKLFNIVETIIRDEAFIKNLKKVAKAVDAVRFDKEEIKAMSNDEKKDFTRNTKLEVVSNALGKKSNEPIDFLKKLEERNKNKNRP